MQRQNQRLLIIAVAVPVKTPLRSQFCTRCNLFLLEVVYERLRPCAAFGQKGACRLPAAVAVAFAELRLFQRRRIHTVRCGYFQLHAPDGILCSRLLQLHTFDAGHRRYAGGVRFHFQGIRRAEGGDIAIFRVYLLIFVHKHNSSRVDCKHNLLVEFAVSIPVEPPGGRIRIRLLQDVFIQRNRHIKRRGIRFFRRLEGL